MKDKKDKMAKNQKCCPHEEIAAYLDGELDVSREVALEHHFAVCQACLEELNEQKKLLCALDFALEDEGREEIQLPGNFTKVVVTNAESRVRGLRCPRERGRALWVCIALFLLILFGLGTETSKAFGLVETVADRTMIVGGFLAHVVSNLTVAVGVILRSLCLQFILKSAFTAFLLSLFFFLSLYIFSRLLSHQNKH
jgi:hypothetical protein